MESINSVEHEIDWDKANAILKSLQDEGNMVIDGHSGKANRVSQVAIFGIPGDSESQSVVWLPDSIRFKYITCFSINPIVMKDGVPTLDRWSVGGTITYNGVSLEAECERYNYGRNDIKTKRFLRIINLGG